MITRQTIHRIGTIALSISYIALTSSAQFAIAGQVLRQERQTASHTVALRNSLASIPLAFEPNLGQAPHSADFISRGQGYTALIGAGGLALRMEKIRSGQRETAIVGVRLMGSASDPSAHGEDLLPGHSSYLFGSHSTRWLRNVPQYKRVHFSNIYPGVDLDYYGTQRMVEHDFVVHSGADPSRIALAITGAKSTVISKNGDLVADLSGGEVRMLRPVAYQIKGGIRSGVSASYTLSSRGVVQFHLAAYNHKLPLIIDPTFAYSTYLGGSGDDMANAIAVDQAGNVYIAGSTTSVDFPLANAMRSVPAATDGFITKISSTGTAILYSTYIGGSGDDIARGLAVDSAGDAYVVGQTTSADFPVTAGAFQSIAEGGVDAFAIKVNPTGNNLLYSTYIGGNGNDVANAVAVDSSGSAYVCGGTFSTNFPTTNAAYQTLPAGIENAFIVKLNSTGSGATYSTYLGGNANDVANGIAVDSNGRAFVTGDTTSTNFPMLNSIPGGSGNAFVSGLNAAGSALVFSTYIPNTAHGNAIAVDGSGKLYVGGATSSAAFDATVNSAQPAYGGGLDGFVAKLDPTQLGAAVLVYATFIGGTADDQVNAIAVDASGAAYITGTTSSTDFPVARAIQPNLAGGSDAFAARISPDGSRFIFSTYIGGSQPDEGNAIAVDQKGTVYVAGATSSTDFPTSTPIQIANGGGVEDAFVSAIVDSPDAPTALTAVAPSTSEVDLSWVNNALNQTSFTIYRAVGYPAGAFTLLQQVSASTLSYSDTTVQPDITYTYEVTANNAYGSSSPDTVIDPQAPSALSVTSTTQTSINLSWTDTQPDFTQFVLEREVGTGPYTQIGAFPPGTTSYTDNAVTAAVIYHYRVRAMNGLGLSAPSISVAATTLPALPATPINQTAQVISASEIDLSWTAAGANQTGFKVLRSTNLAGPWTNASLVAMTGPAVSTFADTGLAPNTTYYYEILATNQAGDSPDPATPISATTLPLPPAAPTALQASAVSDTEIDLSWTISPTNQTGFNVMRKTGTGSFALVATVGPTVLTYSDLGLTQNTVYTYEIIAVNTGGDSSPSNQSSASTLLTPPLAPTGLTVQTPSTPNGQTTLALSWNDANGDFSEFSILRQSGSGAFVQVATLTPPAPVGAAFTYTDTGLSPNTSYQYEVVATNPLSGSSQPDGPASGTTLPNLPHAPTSFTATAFSQTQVNLTWADSSADFAGFIVYRQVGGSGTFDQYQNFTTTAATYAWSDTGLQPNTTYAYEVVAYNAAGNSATTPIVTVITQPIAPIAPTGLVATPVSPTQINLSWVDNNGDVQNFLVQSQDEFGTFQTIATLGPNTTSYSNTNLTPNTQYIYQVVAVNAGGSTPSAQASATTFPVAPSAPSGLTANVAAAPAGQTEIDLTWTSPGTETSELVQRYGPGQVFTTIATLAGGSTSYSDIGLNAGTNYTYQIIAVNAGGASTPSASASATTLPVSPAVPTNLSASAPVTPVGQTEIDLVWTDTTGDFTGFIIQRQTGGTGAFTVIQVITGAQNSYQDTGLTPGTQYAYEVIATNAGGQSPATNPVQVSTLPLAPPTLTGLSANVSAPPLGQTEITLSWTAAGPETDTIVIQRQTGAGPWQNLQTVPGSQTSYQDAGLTPGTTYNYRIIAQNAGGYSTASSQVSGTTFPLAPGGTITLTASPITATQINLVWTPADGTQTSYLVQRKLGSNPATAFTLLSQVAGNILAFADNNLSANSIYSYQIIALNSGGQGQPSNIVTATTLPNPPVTPSQLTSSNLSQTSVTLTWTDANNDATGFTVLQGTNGGPFLPVAPTVGPTISTYNVTGLTANTAYAFQVIATNTGGQSGPSNTVSVNTLPNVPSGIVRLTALTISASEIDLSWSYTLNDNTSFLVERNTGAASFATVAIINAATHTMQDTGLSANTTYNYRVSAINAGGASAPSSIVSATTLPNPPASPAGVTATPLSSTQIQIAWVNAGGGATSFIIQRRSISGVFATVGTKSGGSTTFVDSTAEAATSYVYQVIAVGPGGNSTPSNLASATTPPGVPGTPLNVSGVAGPIAQTQISLTWTPADDYATSYTVLRETGAGGFTLIATVPATTTTYQDSGLTSATTYTYEVEAVSSAVTSQPSQPVVISTLPDPPSAPTGITATASGSTITLTWNAVTGATGYWVKWALKSGGPFTKLPSLTTGPSVSIPGAIAGVTYYYEISTVNSAGEGSNSSLVSVTPVAVGLPQAPNGLTATASGSTITLTWSPVAGATGYWVKWALKSGGPFAKLSSLTTGTSVSLPGAVAGVTYYYEVSAVNSVGEGAYSGQVSVIPAAGGLPQMPNGLTATASGSTITLTWNPVAGATGYWVKWALQSGGPFTKLSSPTTGTSVSLPGAVAGVTYYYEVSAVNSVGEGANSDQASITLPLAGLPQAPSGVIATASGSTITLAWNPVTGATGYWVKWALQSGGPFTKLSSPTTGTTASLPGAVVGVTYYYEVSAINSVGEGANSTQVSVTPTLAGFPQAPGGVIATATGSTITLAWDPVAGVTGYWVKWALQNGGPFTKLSSLTTGTSVSLPGAVVGVTYYYEVSAVNNVGEGTNSAQVSITPNVTGLPPAPSGVTATATGSIITLTWNAVGGATGYWVKWALKSGGPFTKLSSPTTGTGLSLTGAVAGVTYYYEVSAINPVGEGVNSAQVSVTD